jgi:uncharacterized membrane protein
MASISPDGIKDKMAENVNTYMMNTHYLNDYNEIYNVNNYLDERTQLEKDRLQSMYERLNSNTLRLRQEYLLKRFDVQNYKYKISMISYAIILVCVLLILTIMYTDGKVSRNILFGVVGTSTVLFALIVFLISKSNSYREKTNWDMYYWGPVEKK